MKKLYTKIAIGLLALNTLHAADINQLLQSYPANNQQALCQANAALVAAGPDTIKNICRMLVPYNPKQDLKVRYALNGIARYVTRPNAENERLTVSTALCEALPQLTDFATKRFVIVLLERCGRDESIPVLTTFFNDPDLCETAIHALANMKTDAANKALLNGLNSANSKCRTKILHALGANRYLPAAKKIMQTAIRHPAKNPEHDAALAALANMGVPEASQIIMAGVKNLKGRALAEKIELMQRQARRLVEQDHKRNATMIYMLLLQLKSDDKMLISGTQADAIKGLVDTIGDNAVSTLTELCATADQALLSSIADQAERIRPYTTVYRALALRDIFFQYRLYSFEAHKKNRAAAQKLLDALKNDSPNRDRIYPLTRGLDQTLVAGTLIEICADKQSQQQAIVWLMELPNTIIIPTIKAVWTTATPTQKLALHSIIRQRQIMDFEQNLMDELTSTNSQLRTDAISTLGAIGSSSALKYMTTNYMSSKDVTERRKTLRVIAGFCKQTGNTQPLIELMTNPNSCKDVFPYLAAIGGNDALSKTVREMQNKNPDIKDAATRALLKWKTKDAIPHLMQLAEKTPELKYNALAIASIRKLTIAQQTKQNLNSLVKAYNLARRPEDKAIIQDSILSFMLNKKLIKNVSTDDKNLINSSYKILRDEQQMKVKSIYEGIL